MAGEWDSMSSQFCVLFRSQAEEHPAPSIGDTSYNMATSCDVLQSLKWRNAGRLN